MGTLSHGSIGKLLTWHAELNNPDLLKSRENRARLRRCAKPEEVIVNVSAFHQIYAQLAESPDPMISACVIGLLAHVEIDNKVDFAKALGKNKTGTDRSLMSESRFLQLMESRNINELYRNMRRAIVLLDRQLNVFSFVHDIFQWRKEQENKHAIPSKETVHIRWALEYFGDSN